MASTVQQQVIGKTKDGKDVHMFTLEAGKIKVRVLNFGCVVKDILVPDKDGKVVDVVIGYEDFEGYESNPAYLGSICGRVANRIDKGTFQLDGKTMQVSVNDPLGNNFVHGGFLGLTRRYFDWKINGSQLELSYTDVDGAEGFPGEVKIIVTYELTQEHGLMMDYRATTTKPTPIDLANHFMFNLAGHSAGYDGEHVITMNSQERLEFNESFIPTGKIISVEGTVLDVRKPRRLQEVIEQLPNKDGLHFGHVIPGKKGERKFVARAEHPASGRYMEVYSTEPVFISYSCYYLELLMKNSTGKTKDGATYKESGGLLFMPQGYPNAVNVPEFPSCILRPGETYHTTSWYKFGVM